LNHFPWAAAATYMYMRSPAHKPNPHTPAQGGPRATRVWSTTYNTYGTVTVQDSTACFLRSQRPSAEARRRVLEVSQSLQAHWRLWTARLISVSPRRVVMMPKTR